MSNSIHVQSTQAIVELKNSLKQFQHDTQASLDTITHHIRRFQEWLEEREYYWRRRAESDEGNAEAWEELEKVRYWKRKVAEAVNEYQRQAYRLGYLLNNDVPKARTFLERKVVQLEAFRMENPDSGGIMGNPSSLSARAIYNPEGTKNVLKKVPQRIKRQILGAFKKSIKYGRLMQQGKAGENVALLSGQRILLDDIVTQLQGEAEGGRFKIYDILGEDGVYSVKTRAIYPATLSQNTLRLYKDDFRLAIGADYNYMIRFESAAKLLLEAKKKHLIPISSSMQSVTTVDAMKAYLRERGQLLIPDNHVDAVRKALYEEMTQFPENFGLSKQITEEEKVHLIQRVKPLGTTSEVIGETLNMYLSGKLQ